MKAQGGFALAYKTFPTILGKIGADEETYQFLHHDVSLGECTPCAAERACVLM
jgi:hypothetical protein